MKDIISLYSRATTAIWGVLISVKMTIVVLILILSTCVIGSIIPQKGMISTSFEKIYTPTQLKWMTASGLFDIFHSPVFVLFLLLLALNLIACSFERLPKIWKNTFHVPPPPVRDPLLSDWTIEQARKAKYVLHRLGSGDIKTVREAKMATLLFFEKFFGKYQILHDDDDRFQVMLEKGKYSRLGVYILHISLLMIMFGGVMGALYGFEGGVNIEEGTRVSWIQHNRGSRAGMPLLRENGIPVKGYLSLPFEVECQRFSLKTYDGTRPKDFRSWLHFYENDVKVASTEISVNQPFTYKGITFYQASYSELGVGAADVRVFRSKTDNEVVEYVKPGDFYRIDGDAGFRVTHIEPNMMNLGPAAKVDYFPRKGMKKPESFWIFQSLPGFDFAHRKDAKIHFVLDALKPKYATGLSVAKDPGVWIVWIGSGILIAALFLALYTHHGRYWVTYTKKTGFTVVGWSNKLFLYEPRFQKFFDAFRKEFKL